MRRNKLMPAVIMCMAVMALSGCGNNEEMYDPGMMDMEEEEPAINVETAYPEVKTIACTGSYMGTIEAGEKVSVIPRVSGRILARYFGAGDHVNSGDVLFTIDNTELLEEKEKAQAELNDAKAELVRTQAENEATKFAANEALFTMDTGSIEKNNDVSKAARGEYEARIRLYKACKEEGLHKEQDKDLEDLMKDDDRNIESAKEYAEKTRKDQAKYDRIAGAKDADAARAEAGDNTLEGSTPDEVALSWLKKNTAFDKPSELKAAVSSAESAVDSAESAKDSHENAHRENQITILGDQVSIENAKDEIADSQDDLELKRKLAADYEIYTKAKIWAEQQYRLTDGNISVLLQNSKVSRAQSELDIINAKLGYTSVTSPVSGEITGCSIEDLGLASDQSAAYTITDPSKKKAVFYVTGEAKSNLSEGQTVTIEKGGEDHIASIDLVSAAPDEKNRLYKVTAVLDENDMDAFDAGITVRLVATVKKSENTMTVPIGVVYYDEGRAFVYVAKDGLAVKTPIETGIDDATDIEVLSGLSQDDQVIVNWSAQLQDNAQINITKTAQPQEDAKKASSEETGKASAEEAGKAAAEGSAENTVKEEQGETAMPEENEKAEPAEETPADVYIETTSKVNVRKGPSKDSEKLGTVPEGEKFLSAGEENGWTKVIYEDGEAWISSDYVRECER
ncbi:MAG: efflux RND transporter periplasmic adaptor subunit [Lachnospiraceae bacterium]|nr:efflux RND transporter periplasmic adaptor subunit [Lachnospiraceae bacterium]